MTSTATRTWLITGAGRGMDVDFAQAALAAGHNVVATGGKVDVHRELSTNLAHDARVAA